MVVKEYQDTLERRKHILMLLSAKEQVYVRELSTRFNVTEVTIGNDLKRLQKQDFLIRFRCGANLSRNM
jgi:DeoR/GlpR family transcriptional regulator of sugar metabolism